MPLNDANAHNELEGPGIETIVCASNNTLMIAAIANILSKMSMFLASDGATTAAIPMYNFAGPHFKKDRPVPHEDNGLTSGR